jgi:hypothetical protein
MILLHAIARRAGRARPGSILNQSDGLRVWFAGLVMLLCLNLVLMISAGAATPVRLSILVVTAGGSLILTVCDLLLTRRLAGMAAGASLGRTTVSISLFRGSISEQPSASARSPSSHAGVLHTSRVHVETFSRLAREVDEKIPVRHEVREDCCPTRLQPSEVRGDGCRKDVLESKG